KGMSRAWVIAILIALCPASARAEELMIVVRPTEVDQGGVVEIVISGSGLADLKARRNAEDVPVLPVEAGSYVALIGVDLEQRPGPVEILLSGRSPDESWKRTAKIDVKLKNFPREEIIVPPKFDQLDAATLKRIKKEQAALDRLFAVRSAGRLWQG